MWVKNFSLKILSAITALFFFTAANFTSFQNLGLPEKYFPAKNQYGKVESVSEAAGFPGFIAFKVSASHGSYEVETLANLRKVFLEIQALETLNESGKKGGFAEGASDSVKDTGEGLKQLVTDPGESAKNVGSAAKKLGSSIGGVFRKKEKGEKGSMGDVLFSSTKREIATKMGVDVYSRNSYLQTKLDGMARAQMGGKGAVMIVKFLIPLGALVSLTITAGSLNKAADELVNNTGKGDLFRINKEALIGLGFAENQVIVFLNHSFYTPREVTYLRFYLEKLKGVPGIESLLDAATKAGAGIPAFKILYEAELAAESLSGPAMEAGLTVFSEGLALKQGTKLFFLTGYDYLDKSSLGDKIVDQALALKNQLGCQSVEIQNAGKVTAGFAASALLRGISSKGLVLFEPDGLTE